MHIQVGARQWGMIRSQRVAAGSYPRQAWREVEAVPVVDCTKALKRKVQRSVDLFLGKESR